MTLDEIVLPALTRGLTNLSGLLDKAAAHAEARKFDAQVLVQSRLYPDMLPLVRQVQIACDTSKGAVARLTQVENPKHEDNETTLAELKARIARTLDFIRSASKSQFEGAETRKVTLQFPNGTMEFLGLDYVRGFVLPNFYFHVTTAYAILRHNGVEIGKGDYLGRD